MQDILFFLAVAIVLFLPGGVWLLVTRPAGMDAVERIGEAAGASVALTALAALGLSWAGLRVSAAGMIGLYAALPLVGLGLFAWRRGRPRWNMDGWGLLGVGALLALIAWRLYQARGLVLPAWVDSVHHVLLVRKMLEFGGLPPDWLPYLNAPMYYHYGFHILTAAFSFWSRLEPQQAVLLFGQVLNALVAFSVYRLARAVWGDPRRAGLAALLTAFGFHMPAYYLTWGRYPLTVGLIVLPLAMAAALEVRHRPSDRAAWARLVLYTAGVCVCHFLAVGLLGLFFLVLLAAEGMRLLQKRSLREVRWEPFAAAALGAVISAPWLIWVWGYTRQEFAVSLPDPLAQAGAGAAAWDYIVYLTGPQRSHILLALAGVGLLAALLPALDRASQRREKARVVALWGLTLAFMATPYGPVFNPFRPDHLAIVLFLPGSLLLAGLLVDCGEFLAARVGPLFPGWKPELPGWIFAVFLPLTVGAGISAWGVWETRDIVNPATVLTEPADLVALRWVQENTPADARFFINSTPWLSAIYRGVDGGYWLMPITGRFSLVPPAAFAWGKREDLLRIIQWDKRAAEVKTCDEAFWSLVREAQLGFVYLRNGTGSLQPDALAGCQGVDQIYSQAGVFIYRLAP
jgi:hypothetical protein